VRWRLASELRLAADLDLLHGGEMFPLTLTYPVFFPDTPPSVVPADARRISGHQYGTGGSSVSNTGPTTGSRRSRAP
jgi:sulfur-carrier protein adenylyltransferase/sulfurtransferase